MHVSSSRSVVAIGGPDPGATQRGGVRVGAMGGRPQTATSSTVEVVERDAAEPRHARGFEAFQAVHGKIGAGGLRSAVLLAAMIHHMGGAATSSYKGMYISIAV